MKILNELLAWLIGIAVFATFKTLEDLFINTGDEYDKLINVEINEI